MGLSAVRGHGGESRSHVRERMEVGVPSEMTGSPAGHNCCSMRQFRDSTHEGNRMFLSRDASLSRAGRAVGRRAACDVAADRSPVTAGPPRGPRRPGEAGARRLRRYPGSSVRQPASAKPPAGPGAPRPGGVNGSTDVRAPLCRYCQPRPMCRWPGPLRSVARPGLTCSAEPAGRGAELTGRRGLAHDVLVSERRLRHHPKTATSKTTWAVLCQAHRRRRSSPRLRGRHPHASAPRSWRTLLDQPGILMAVVSPAPLRGIPAI